MPTSSGVDVSSSQPTSRASRSPRQATTRPPTRTGRGSLQSRRVSESLRHRRRLLSQRETAHHCSEKSPRASICRPEGHHSARRAAASPTACEARNELKPPAASASLRAGRGSGVPGPARSVTSTRTSRSPSMTATVTVSPGAAEPHAAHCCRRSRSPARQPHPRTGAQGQAPRTRTRGRPAPAPPVRQASRSPGPPPWPSPHPPFPGRPAPGNRRAAGGRRDMYAQTPPRTSSHDTPRRSRPQPTWRRPSAVDSSILAPVRGRPRKATVTRTAPRPRSRPPCVRGHRNTTAYSATT